MPSSAKRAIRSSDRVQLAVVARRPAEEGEEVEHRLGQVALRLVLEDRRGAVALAQALLVGAEDHRHVREGRHRRAHRGEQQHVLGRVRDVIVAADHVRDRHVDVVADHRQVIDRQPVAADDDEVVDAGVVELDRALHEIGERRAALGHLEADRARRAVRGQLAGLRLGQRPLAADVAPHLAAGLGRLARLVVLLGRREVVVGVAGRDQPLGGGAMPIEALRLEVRAVRAADVRALRPRSCPASASPGGCRRPSRPTIARRRCPRCGARTRRPRGGRAAS